MRNWRSTLFYGILALVAIELCFVVVFYLRDGQIKHASSTAESVALATSAPSGTQLDVASAAPMRNTGVTDSRATKAPATAAPASVTRATNVVANNGQTNASEPRAPAGAGSATAAPTVSPAPTSPATASPATASPATASPATTSPATASPNPKPLTTMKPRIVRIVVADATAFRYEGHWEHIAGKHDGRIAGKSSRTFAKGARATLAFSGRFVRLYGVLGPGGGFGAVRLDGGRPKIVDFFAANKATHRLIYSSPMLAAGDHRVSLVVVPDPKIASARTQYVNIDSAEYGT